MKNTKAQMRLTFGFMLRLIGGFIQVLSIPFMITTPNNIIAWLFFSIGSGLLTVGGVMN